MDPQDHHGVVSHDVYSDGAFLFLENGLNLNCPYWIQIGVEHLILLTYFLPNGQVFELHL